MIITPEDIKIVVNPDPSVFIYTGTSLQNAVGSGATTVTISGNSIVVYTPFGTSVNWGAIQGTLSDQTDLQAALNAKLATTVFNSYTGDTQSELSALSASTTANTASILSNTNDIVTISGTTVSLSSAFNTHSGDTTIHFEQTDIDYNNLQNLPTLFSGDYDDLTNKPDLGIYALETDLDNYVPASGGTFSGDLQGTSLQLSGDLTVNGTMNVIHIEQVFTENDFIYMRLSATTGLGVSEVSGIAALNVDGLGTTAVMGVTQDGIIRVGWSGDTLQAVATREDTPTNLGIAIWSDSDDMFVTTGGTISDIESKILWTGTTNDGITPLGGYKRLVIPAKDDAANTASVIGGNAEHTSFGGSMLDIFSVDTFSYSHNLRLIDSSPLNANNAWLHAYAGNDNHMFKLQYVGADQVGQLIFLDTNEAIKGTFQWGDDADTYYHFGTGSRIGTAKVSIRGDLAVDGNISADNYNTFTGDTNSQITYISGQTDTKADKLVTINSVTTDYTTVDGDSNEILECTSGCTGVTLHSGATNGFQVTFVNLDGHTLTFSAQSGSTLTSKGDAVTLVDAYGAVSAYKNGSVWRLIGDLT